MYNDGKLTQEIADELGVNYSLVSCAVKRGRDAGIIPPTQPASPFSDGVPYHLNKGTMGYVVSNLTRKQQIWLARKAKKYGCQSMAEIILELIRDVHASQRPHDQRRI